MSSDLAISAVGVGKDYRLGLSGRTRSLAAIAAHRARHPFTRGLTARELFTALDDVSFDVARGEVVGVVGKNGAGKSTLLKILSQITVPDRGAIDIRGRVGCLIEVGTGFHPELTGSENIYLNGAILGMKRRTIEQRYDEIVEFAGIPGFLDTPVKRYSSGMRVRLAFAVAAHLDPEILVVDEVLSVGDFTFQAKCLEKMRAIAADDGRTVLYVSHNLVTVEHLCPRSLLLVDGRLAFDGPTEETVSRYRHTIPRAERGAQPGTFDLAAGDRSGGRYAAELFKGLELRPRGEGPSDTMRMGEPLQIAIAVEGLDATPEANVHVTVGSPSCACVFRMTSRMLPLSVANGRRPAETILIDIPSLPLTPGDYHLDVGALGRDAVLLDEVHRAAEFTVVPADVLGTGYHFAARDGHVTIPWTWEVRPAESEAGDRS